MYNDKQYFGLHRLKYPYDKIKTVKTLLHNIDNVFYLTLPLGKLSAMNIY